MRYRLGDIRLVPPVVAPAPKAAVPDKVVERSTVTAAATPLLVKRDVGPKSVEVVAIPPTRTQEVNGDHQRDKDQQRKDKL